MAIKFITGNKGKFEEAHLIMPELEQLDLDLPEIQELDAKTIIAEKLSAAEKYHKGEYIVEDVSLYLECFDWKFPGPLIKWYLGALKPEGIFRVASLINKFGVRATEIVGYISQSGKIDYFEGVVEGTIVPPKGDGGFGWSPVFKPNGHSRTFSEMTSEERNQISMRGIAMRKLKEFLENKL